MHRYVLWVLYVIFMWAAFVWSPEAAGFGGHVSRVVFFHVPTAWVAVAAFVWCFTSSVRVLRGTRRDLRDLDDSAVSAASVGLLFTLLATATGALFARATWGQFWNWDPRETSIAFLILIWAAYFVLRSAIPDPDRRSTVAAAYAVLGFIAVPFLVFVVPRMVWSLHPDTLINTRGKVEMAPKMVAVLIMGLVVNSWLAWWIYDLVCRIRKVERKVELW